MEKLKLGFIGIGQRGKSLLRVALAIEEAEVVAVCDVYPDRVEEGKGIVKEKQELVPNGYTRSDDLIADKNVQAVVISAAWEAHVDLAVACMKAGIPVGLEVGGAYDVEDCWKLVNTYEETKTPIMFLENCCYDRFELLSTALVRAGKMGEIVHCHGAYSHDLRDEILGGNVNRHYRLENYKRRNCDNYPTHQLGPIARLLNINRGNRMVSLVSVASKAVGLEAYTHSEKCPDKTLKGTKFAQGDIVNTIITCANGETISMTLDTTLPKYYSREFTVRGTEGLAIQEANMILLESDCSLHEYWEPQQAIRKYMDNASEYDAYLPSYWRDVTEEEKALGHGGMDYYMLRSFVLAVAEKKEMPIDVYDAAAWMSITALTEKSIALQGAPVTVPDFTRGKWVRRLPEDVIDLSVGK